MAMFFTSDLHLGHANSIQHSNRPFRDVDDMNRTLINNINEMVSENDELWVVGDFSYRIGQEEVRNLRNQIRCKNVHLVQGNHDKKYAGTGIFQSVQDYKELKTDYGKIVLFHYPISDWNTKHYGAIHLHGHIHSTGEYNRTNLHIDADKYLIEGHVARQSNLKLRIYDVGVDANQYYPVDLDYIAQLMNINTTK